ncbi:MAG TPA: DUF1054 domain-containing protein [Bacillota bacterium]|nr:DUF1054 domain-containing protein [Bacillota bacterium]
MTFSGFEQKDFESFAIEGLEGRMEAIQQRIQPKFQELGEELVDYLATHVGNEMHIHIAKHARRTVNPPNDTWVAFSYNKRGYKMTPHFQVGLWDDRLFVWLAYIYELPNKKEMAQLFIDHMDDFSEMIPKDFDISMNHMKKSDTRMEDADLEKTLTRFRDVKSAELLIGKQFSADDPLLADGEKFMREVESICDALIPIYQMSLEY